MTTLWRIHLKATPDRGVDQRQFCIGRGLLGIGWPVTHDGIAPDFDAYCRLAREQGHAGGWLRAARAVKDMKRDDLVWTRDLNGFYYLGRVRDDEWRYETGDDFARADSVQVRSCEWTKVGTAEAVPGGIVNRFIRGHTVQRIDDTRMLAFSQQAYNDKSTGHRYDILPISGGIWSFLSPDDCEDIVGVYMQSLGYVMIPSTCKASTPAYEFEMLHRDTGRRAIAQVKQGTTPLNRDDYTVYQDCDVFLFTSDGFYTGAEAPTIRCLTQLEMSAFVADNERLMPLKIRSWLSLHRALSSG